MNLTTASLLPRSFRCPIGPVETVGKHVYLMTVPSGRYKIGVARDPRYRLGMLQVGNPEPITLEGHTQLGASGISAYEFERRIHNVLAEYRIRGEWFEGPLERAFIAWKYVWLSFARPAVIERWHRRALS